MGLPVSQVNVAVRADVDTVGVAKLLVPGLYEVPFPVEDHQLVTAAIEQVHLLVPVHRYASDLVELVSLR